jgi:hypothetical protein
VRFSLKWALASVAYVAIAAAALGRKTIGFTDALWAVTFLAFALAALHAFNSRGRRQVAALAFVFFSATYFAFLMFGCELLPVSRLLRATGIDDFYTKPRSFLNILNLVPDLNASLRCGWAANAIATMAFGLLGSLVGLMAFRASALGNGTNGK